MRRRIADPAAPVPRWLGTRLLGALLTPKSENDKCAKQLRSSAGVIVFVSDANDQQHWIEDLVVRFGRGPEMPRSRRRPIEQVLA